MRLTTTWALQPDDFLQESRHGHPRKRERWLALYWMVQNVSQAEIARRLGRTRETIQIWKEAFEQNGPESLNFTRSGGRQKKLSEDEEETLAYSE